MPRNVTDPTRYPDYYHTIWQLAAQNNGHFVTCNNEKDAKQMRLELYSLRTAYTNADWNIRASIAHMQIVLRPGPEGKVNLTIRDANDSALAQAALASLKGMELADPRTGKMTPVHPNELPTFSAPEEPEQPIVDTSMPGEPKPGEKLF